MTFPMTPRDIVEPAIERLANAMRVDTWHSCWTEFRGEIFRAFNMADDRLGNCLREQRAQLARIESLEAALRERDRTIADCHREIADLNVQVEQRHMASQIQTHRP